MKPALLSLHTSTNVPACLVKTQRIVQMVSICSHANAPRDTQGTLCQTSEGGIWFYSYKNVIVQSTYPTKTTLGALSWCNVILRKVLDISLRIASAADCPQVLFFFKKFCVDGLSNEPRADTRIICIVLIISFLRTT